jgi:eukaryotic-like serine/threonine-protein kinase
VNEPLDRLESLFAAALPMPPADRAAYLDRTCADDSALRQRVEALLRAQEAAGNFLQTPPASICATVDEPWVAEHPGMVIGPYKLLEAIGEGGFGVVFLAEQSRPVRRQVALKVLKPGMDTRQVVARFEAERQALALMDHPNIAQVYDGGATASGRPYFVMELVKGVPITEFCDQNRLTPRQRLELFVPVCQAVQHAHQKGIIHRDLKPSNVLVAVHDGTPVVKVIDFGVAKALGQELTDKTVCTGLAQMIGTPLYMSPEQAGQCGLDIDTRSDIYSLGVLLYELLTGTTPFDKERLRTAAYDEIRRIIREEEPPRPSTRLSALGQAAAPLTAKRQGDRRRLSRLYRGEVDWVVMKCLEKDRSRRYETANGLAMDLQRYLADEPVLACPPSAGYRLRKFVRRHRGPVLAACVIALALVGGTVGATWGLLAARAARDAEAKERQDVEAAKDRALKASAELEKNLYEHAIALGYHEWQSGNPRRAEEIVAASRREDSGWEWHYLNRLCHADLVTLAGHDAPLQSVAFSPDGRLVAAGSGRWGEDRPGEVIVWEAVTGHEVLTLRGHTRNVTSVAFSPDGRHLASAGLDPAVRVWDVTTGRQTAFHPGRGGWIRSVAFSPDGGLNFFLVTADMHWPLYEHTRRGLADLLARGRGVRDQVVVAGVCYPTQPEFCTAPFRELAEAVPGLKTLDVLLAGGANGAEFARRLPVYRTHRLSGFLGSRAVGATFHDRGAALTAVLRRQVDLACIRYNPGHPGARRDLFPHLPDRPRPLLFGFKSTFGHVPPARMAELGLPGPEYWHPAVTDHYRFALTRPELDGLLIAPRTPGEIAALAAALEQGPLTEEEEAYLLDVAGVARGAARVVPES